MRRNTPSAAALFLFAAFAALGSAGCHRDKCLAACQATAKALNCNHADQCKSNCDTLHNSPVCNPEMKAFEACFIKEPPDHWQCDLDGVPAVSEDSCTLERGKVSDCLSRLPPPPLPAPGKH